MAQLKDRYHNKLQSQVQSLRLAHDKSRTQVKIDNERKLQAMRDEIKARVESKYLGMENEERSKTYQKLRDLETNILDKGRIDAQNESSQRMSIIQKEYDIIFDSLRKDNVTVMDSITQK